jgi:hypothetical protein
MCKPTSLFDARLTKKFEFREDELLLAYHGHQSRNRQQVEDLMCTFLTQWLFPGDPNVGRRLASPKHAERGWVYLRMKVGFSYFDVWGNATDSEPIFPHVGSREPMHQSKASGGPGLFVLPSLPFGFYV